MVHFTENIWWSSDNWLSESQRTSTPQRTSNKTDIGYFKILDELYAIKSLIRKIEESSNSHVNCEDLPEWKGNCCLASPVCASQIIVVWDRKEKYTAKKLERVYHRCIN